ncbi:putative D-xylose 1-dehydrogenase [Dipodascopsis uninucleata]
MTNTSLPTLRWGIIGAGNIAAQFVEDLQINRPDAKANHIISAVGSSSLERAKSFIAANCTSSSPVPYGSYEGVYSDPQVDIVYVATPHSLHPKEVLSAIAHGKNVLCEKPVTVNEKVAKTLFDAAKAKNVFLMEGMWIRFMPAVAKMQSLVHDEKVIGDVTRVYVDYSNIIEEYEGPESSRFLDLSLGAGILLDMGVYNLTLAKLALDKNLGYNSEKPEVKGTFTLAKTGADNMATVVLKYPSTGRQGILTLSAYNTTDFTRFMTIQGTKGEIIVGGLQTCMPRQVTVKYNDSTKEDEFYDYTVPGYGFFFEADACALDIANGKKQDDLMPWNESLFVMSLLDEARLQNGGTVYPEDK